MEESTLYQIIVDFLGEPPNELIMNLYYVLAVVLVIFTLKVALSVMRSIFHVSRY